MTIDATLNTILRLLLPVAALALSALAVIALLDRMTQGDKAAELRVLKQRDAELTALALAPGSTLSCLAGGAGEAVEAACEKTVFASAEAAAAAVAYTAARLTLLKDAAAVQDAALLEVLAPNRRALELDRFGLTAHVLAEREGCSVERCLSFALLRDTGAVKANLKAQAYDVYVARYAGSWTKTEPKPAPVAEAQPSTPAGPAVASVSEPAESAGHTPVSSKYDFPSAASIPPVSIMNVEPLLPKAAEAKDGPKETAKAAEDTDAVPVPPKRPQAQVAAPAR